MPEWDKTRVTLHLLPLDRINSCTAPTTPSLPAFLIEFALPSFPKTFT